VEKSCRVQLVNYCDFFLAFVCVSFPNNDVLVIC
jgi:hypothetical protein